MRCLAADYDAKELWLVFLITWTICYLYGFVNEGKTRFENNAADFNLIFLTECADYREICTGARIHFI